MLTSNKGLPKDLHDHIWKTKQEMTLRVIDKYNPDDRLREVLRKLRMDGYILCVASNSIRETVKMMLIRKGLMEFFDFFFFESGCKKS